MLTKPTREELKQIALDVLLAASPVLTIAAVLGVFILLTKVSL